jgi:hypothetical protein
MEVCRRWIEEQRSFIVPQAFLERISRSSHGLKVTRAPFVLTDPMGEEEGPILGSGVLCCGFLPRWKSNLQHLLILQNHWSVNMATFDP